MLESNLMWSFVARQCFLFFVVAAALAVDQATKFAVIQTLDLGSSWPESGFFRFTHVGNNGSAFGLFGDSNSLLIIASFVGVGVLLYFYRSHPNPTLIVRSSLGLMLAGALGNLIDRLVNGHVTDFIDVGPWWIFNLADASIMTGISVLAATMLLSSKPQPAADTLHDADDAPFEAELALAGSEDVDRDPDATGDVRHDDDPAPG